MVTYRPQVDYIVDSTMTAPIKMNDAALDYVVQTTCVGWAALNILSAYKKKVVRNEDRIKRCRLPRDHPDVYHH